MALYPHFRHHREAVANGPCLTKPELTGIKRYRQWKVAHQALWPYRRNVFARIVKSGRTDIEVVPQSMTGPGLETNAHLIRLTASNGRFPVKSTVRDWIDGWPVARFTVTALRDLKDLTWADVDIAMEIARVFSQPR